MPKQTILVVGGAGYIGSYVNQFLNELNYQTIVLDDLSRGSAQAVTVGTLIEGDFGDTTLLNRIFSTYSIDAVIHFAAFTDVGESVLNPLKYYHNNVSNTIHLLKAMQRHQVGYMIFSSTAAIFGNPRTEMIAEDHLCCPINPYGQSKLMVEKILWDLSEARILKFGALRYFNAAGGDPRGKIKNHFFNRKESNLIPIVLRSLKHPGNVAEGCVTVYGTDYPTRDGTCIRDYIHIHDLARAHLLLLQQLQAGAPSSCYNLGNGKGYTVLEVIAAVEKVTGQRVSAVMGERRLGDPSILLANAKKAERQLGWFCEYPDLEAMIAHAL